MSKPQRRRGVSLLEIMLAMSLMSVVIIAFAAVFPSGYRLNLKNLNQAKATGYANAIIEQLSNLSTTRMQDAAALSGDTVNKATALRTGGYITMPTGLATSNPGSPNVFWLQSVLVGRTQGTNPFPNTDPQAGTSNVLAPQIDIYQVTVTIQWLESRRNGGPVTRSSTVTTLINSVMSR